MRAPRSATGAPHAAPTAEPGTLASLQAGRALAALSVAAFHLSIMMGEERYGGVPVFADATRYGYLGVDYFFVLSGFIIAHVHGRDLGRPERLRPYLAKRFLRVWPIYWLYTAVFAGLVLLHLGSATTLPTTAAGWVSSVSLLRLSAEQPPLAVAWTLFHEAAFYAVFAVAIWRRRVGIAVFAAWMMVCAAGLHYPAVEDRTPLAVYGAGYNLDFLLGILASLGSRRCTGRAGAVALALGLAAAAAILAGLYGGAGIPAAPLLLGGAFALVIAGAVGLERAGWLPVPVLLRRLGDASYTIYLVHIAAIGVALKLAMRFGLPDRIGGEATFLASFVAALALCAAAWRFVERPLLAALRGRPGPDLPARGVPRHP